MATKAQAIFAKTNNPEYTDFRDRVVKLTEAEQYFFWNTVDKVLRILEIEIPVFICDHEKLGGTNENALGIHWKSADDEFITIDNFFIHECYEVVFNNAYNLNGEDLKSVLCHELAHIQYQRHTKYHAKLTEEYIAKLNEEV